MVRLQSHMPHSQGSILRPAEKFAPSANRGNGSLAPPDFSGARKLQAYGEMTQSLSGIEPGSAAAVRTLLCRVNN